MTFDREEFLKEMELLKKIPVLENEEFLHQKIIAELKKTKTDLDEISDSE
jgi:transcriptional regulator of NAD metabolism